MSLLVRQLLFCLFFIGLGLQEEAFAQSYARKENNVWINGAEGIDFNASPPKPLNAIWQSYYYEMGSASVCDAQGQLLFYSDGNFIWDRNNNIMLHGRDINNNGNMSPNTCFIEPSFGQSSYNFDGVVILPMPGSSHKYYVFSVPFLYRRQSNGLYADSWQGKLYATIVDMELNKGMGDVDTAYRGVLVAEEMAGNLHAVAGADCNYWLLGYGSNGRYKAFQIDAQGINTTPVESTLDTLFHPSVGELNVSPDGRKAALANFYQVQVSDFDATSGLFSNDTSINVQEAKYMAFSPDSRVLYTSGLVGLCQFNMNALNTPFTLLTINNLTSYEYNAPLRLAPDGKIYLTHCFLDSTQFYNISTTGAVIQQPNVLGAGCQLELLTTKLPLLESDRTIGLSMAEKQFPNEVPVLVYDTVSVVRQIPLCFSRSSRLVPGDTAGSDYHWMVRTVGSSFVRMGNDTTSVLDARSPGTYALQYFSSSPCVFHRDTFFVKEVAFSLYLGDDMVSCDGTPLRLEASVPGAVLLWPDSSQGNSFTVNRSGLYWVQATREGCTISDSIYVSIIDIAQDLGADTNICNEDREAFVLLEAKTAEGSNILWNTGSTDAALYVRNSGLYWVRVENAGCIASDSVYISRQYCDCPVFMPNAFSPNGDGVNDLFLPGIPDNCTVHDFKMIIFNRWGIPVFTSYRHDQGWDGHYKGNPLDAGTYMYQVEMKTGLRDIPFSAKGDLLLLR